MEDPNGVGVLPHVTSAGRSVAWWAHAATAVLAAGVGAAVALAVAGSSNDRAGVLATASLQDGRLELFFVLNGKLFSSWKETPDPNAPWTDLTEFDAQPDETITDVAVGRISDGRLQLFVAGPKGIRTCFKAASDPGSPWTPWVAFGR